MKGIYISLLQMIFRLKTQSCDLEVELLLLFDRLHLSQKKKNLGYPFLYRLRSIATHRDHFVRRLSVRPSVTLSKAMFRR